MRGLSRNGLLLVMSAGLMLGCSESSSVLTPTDSDGETGVQTRMPSFTNAQTMLEQFRRAARAESSAQLAFPVAEVDAVAGNEGAGSAGPGIVTSGTNVQVQGVDEADLIKVSGSKLFALHTRAFASGDADLGVAEEAATSPASSLKRFSLSGPAVLEQEASLPKGVTWDGLYYVESTQQLVLQGEGLTGVYPADLSSYWWNGGEVLLRGVDATGNLDSSTWELSVDGQLLGSRRLGDTLYIVTEYGAPYIHPYAEQSGNIDELTLAEWLPSWRFNGVEQGALVSASDCFRPAVDERRESTRVTALIALPLNNPAQLETRCLLGTSETLYVSQEALYIATTQTYYEGWNSPSFDLIFPTATTTDVHKFSFDDSLSYRGGVSLSGHLGWRAQQRSYRMGEVDGVLSVVTSGGSLWGSMDQNHRLYTLQEQPSGLALVAQLPNENRTGAIGKPGERIYGTRAVGDRVYVVTFLNTDPLYVIDVSDAADPFVAGELEVPGFSDYLHPLGDGLLVGIGKSASAAQEGDESRGGWYQGLRLSLFDVSEPSNPSLINALEYGDRGTDTDLFSDFHALAWRNTSSESAEFALPVSLYRYNSAPEYPWELGDFVHRGLYRFSVDGTGLKEASQSLVDGGAYSYHRDGRAVLANDGDAWFYDDGELYYIHSSSPSVLQASE